MARKVSLTVNGIRINLDSFVEGYVYHITNGIVASLKDTSPVKTLELKVEDTGDIKVNLNGVDVSVNYFVTEIVRSTLGGMVATLKGVEGKLKTLDLKIEQ